MYQKSNDPSLHTLIRLAIGIAFLSLCTVKLNGSNLDILYTKIKVGLLPQPAPRAVSLNKEALKVG